MATNMVSLPPPSPLPPSPPCSPVDLPAETSHTDPGMETPNRSSFTSASFGTSMTSTASDCVGKRRTVSASDAPRVFREEAKPIKRTKVKLEDFELIRVVGKGCAGRVLVVRETATAKILAMKAVSKRSVFAQNELRHTLAEMEIMRKFAMEEPHNPFIVKLHHSFTDRENFYLVMEFYPGGDLATQMEIHGALGHQRTRFYACDIVQGLEDLHRNGIIVRDLKPENILLNSYGHCVLADFGLSKDFGYRGEPKPLHVVTYPGQGLLPPWAGKGAGSVRLTAHGAKKLVVDRAYSFVGTPEYLAPEVVKYAEYSYAVDWWALGIIVLESMIGRVPFQLKKGDPPIVMWNQILFDPWDHIFREMRGTPEHYGLDDVTWHFIDALLSKDPMWRLTEPFVKQHDYFRGVDWTSVSKGEYQDPHGLHFHPITEYNTHYFPKLCLDEEPTVNMRYHDVAYCEGQYEQRTPLNDDGLFLLEQAKFRSELESFAWSRELELNDSTNEPGEVAVIAETPLTIETGESVGTPMEEPIAQAPGSPATYEIACQVPLPSPLSLIESLPPTPPVKPKAIPHVHPGPIAKGSTPRPIPSLLKPTPLKPQRCDLALPTGLPSSGLSVSDVMAIPSPDMDSPGRIIRRHRALPSIDTTPMSRLSIDLHGTITNLGDDDWEQLDAEGIESMPNGQPGTSFLNRVLRRRPSTLYASGLRRQAKTSDTSSRSSASKNASPTKKSSTLFGKSASTKALDKIHGAFPKLRKPSNPPLAFGPGTVGSTGGSPERPSNPHTESTSWFDKRSKARSQPSSSGKGTPRSIKVVDREAGRMTMRRSVSAMPVDWSGKVIRMNEDLREAEMTAEQIEQAIPRVELKKTPPLEIGWLVNDGHRDTTKV